MKELLEQLKEKIAEKISALNFTTWFSPISDARIENDVFIVVVPNKFVADWINDYYRDLFVQELHQLSGKQYRLSFEVKEPQEKEGATKARGAGEPSAAKLDIARLLPQLNPKYTFDRYVVGSSNQFAHAACKAAGELPGGHYNPLFIYGGVGLGKTHLLQAIGNEVARMNPHFTIIYVSSEKFMNELINAIRYDKTGEFRRKYRESCDVLLIDDIQFIAGKERTQDEFFHTFNSLYEAQKQIVMTSDKFPKDIQGLEERLRSRFEWGLIADIQPPDFETRVAILRKKADAEKLHCPDDVAMYLASVVSSNVRELEGSLIRINAFASLTRSPVTVDLAKEVLKNVVNKPQNHCSIESIQKKVASFYQVSVPDLKSPRRHKSLAYPRQIAMYLCKKHAGCSFPEIGSKFGGKDHTTVMHACKKIERLLKDDQKLQSELGALERSLQS
ncbi:MAG: chromosomal replication initiator protein DnaA [Deltaproteobacteria bacterium CG_4_10_14_0_2_um_filter_43_8]|nr:MAG: chromosomal replication initiator protein DnaA [Deltaproteobacteria bacterium CG11_big_fil_rev_8_21_14_0_20_42_23]PJA19247.1 MAG: chromosomal replication initiator protein DnaA [Deltaproteobacteria bacterium CG_4_10_14_0_2_um_filter_43_8]PJC64122.1 MAG: chromosomal replication initiator protein DnaA [Deltaproteobacteria bacterium CG_4_9_14_0_2_um_filter_42_21]